jgi:predicted ATPase
MLESLEIENIKSIESLNFKLKGLNVLSGLNSSGKSTVLGIVLLLKQIERNKVCLNGECVNFVTVGRALFKWRDNLNGYVKYNFSNGSHFDLRLVFDEGNSAANDRTEVDISNEPNVSNQIRYLSSNRINPAWAYNNSISTVEERDFGVSGEGAITYINKLIGKNVLFDNIIHSSLEHSDNKALILDNLNSWMSVISPGVKISVDNMHDINSSKLHFGFRNGGVLDDLSPFSVGFGLTHALPVVLMLLTAVPGDLLIIENPESNLHPEGQVQLGKLISLVADNDVQIIIETHSDHIINSVRMAIKKKLVQHEKVKISFLEIVKGGSISTEKLYTEEREITVLPNGKVINPPKGFFDTWQNSLMELV